MSVYTVEQLANSVKIKRKIPTTNLTTLPYAWFYDTIPEVMRIIHKEVPWWYKTTTVSAVADTQTYALPQGTLSILSAYIDGHSPLGTATLSDLADDKAHNSRGLPLSFVALHDDPATAAIQPGIGLSPIPDASYTVNVWIRQTYAATLSATTAELDMPDDWRDCLVMFLTGFAFEYDQDEVNADRWFTKAGEKLGQLRGIEEDRINQSFAQQKRTGRVKSVGGYLFEADL